MYSRIRDCSTIGSRPRMMSSSSRPRRTTATPRAVLLTLLNLTSFARARNSDELLPVPLSKLPPDEQRKKRKIIDAGAATLPFEPGGKEEQQALKLSLDMTFSLLDGTVSTENALQSLGDLRVELEKLVGGSEVSGGSASVFGGSQRRSSSNPTRHNYYEQELPLPGKRPWPQRLLSRVTTWSATAARNLTRFEHAFSKRKACEILPPFLDEIFLNTVVHQSGENDGEHLSATLPVHEKASELLGRTECCRSIIHRQLFYAWEFLLRPDTKWTSVRENFRSPLFQCLERLFWGGGYGKPLSSIRGLLWDTTMDAMDLRRYGVNEALTTQFAFLPLCVHRTLATEFDRWVDIAQFNAHYMHCQPTHMAFALDHLKISGNHLRFAQVYDYVRTHKFTTLAGMTWWTPHFTAIGGLPGLTAAPWWQLHPKVAPVIAFLEKNFETLAGEVRFLEEDAQLQLDAYRDTARNLRWHMVNLLGDDERAKNSFKKAVKTCRLLEEEYGWNSKEDYSQSRWSWSVVRPGGNMGGHTGQAMRLNVQICAQGCENAELHLNGQVVPYVRGKALAWQDGWRHEVWNHDAEKSRWVFMMTLPHPEYEEAMEAECMGKCRGGEEDGGGVVEADGSDGGSAPGSSSSSRMEESMLVEKADHLNIARAETSSGGTAAQVGLDPVGNMHKVLYDKARSEHHSSNSRRGLAAAEKIAAQVKKSDKALRKRVKNCCSSASWPAAYARLRDPDAEIAAEKFARLTRAKDAYYRE